MSLVKKIGKGFPSKKGNALAESMTVVVLVLGLAMLLLILYGVTSNYNTAVQNSPSSSNQSKAMMASFEATSPDTFDSMVVFLFVGLWAVVLMFAFMIDSHPIFMIISFVFLSFFIGAAAILGNMWEDITATGDISVWASKLPMTNFLITHSVEMVILVGLSMTLVLYGKNKVFGK